MADNPICIGYPWRQAFDFPAGFFEAGDSVRAEVRRELEDAAPLAAVSGADGTTIEGDRLFVELTAAQTAAMPRGNVLTSFVVQRGGEEIAIGQIIVIPVVRLPTRPQP